MRKLTDRSGPFAGDGAGCAGASGGSRRRSVFVPLFTYRTGSVAGSGTYIADGMHDYLSMLNERDGGIGGVKLAIEECETGYDTKKGPRVLRGGQAEESGRRQSVVDRHHAAADPEGRGRQDPCLSMAYGLSAAASATLPVDLQTAGHLLGTACR